MASKEENERLMENIISFEEVTKKIGILNQFQEIFIFGQWLCFAEFEC